MRWAQVVLDDADLAAPSILTGAPAFQGLREGRWARALARLRADNANLREQDRRLAQQLRELEGRLSELGLLGAEAFQRSGLGAPLNTAAPQAQITQLRLQQLLDLRRALEERDEELARAGRPRLLSVRRADVAGLTVAGVDLHACRFVGAHHLDQLRVEESDFASTPKSWR